MEYIIDDDGVEWGVLPGEVEKRRIFRIPQPNMGTFTDKLAKLAKRAVKLGVDAPTYTLVREEPKIYKFETDMEDEHGSPIIEERVVLINHILIYHPKVVVADYEFVCKLEHSDEGNVLHTIAGKIVPHQYRDCEAWCDHCKLHRRRNDTFVLHHTIQDIYIQVGRNCLADFLGRSADSAASAAEMYYTADELGMASEGGGDYSGGGGEQYDMLDTYLEYVAEVITNVGWKSRTVAKEFGGTATADIALFHMHRPRGAKKSDFLFTYPTDASKETSKLSIAWCEDLSDQEVEASDYLHNIRVIARRGVVGHKQYGFAASIVSSYLRHVGELKRRERNVQKPSEWVGTVDERRIFTLLVEKVLSIESDYGVSKLHIMSDDQSNKFIWFSHGATFDEGKTINLRGTIKKHDERNGVKQTILTRCDEVVLKPYLAIANGQSYNFDAEDDKHAKGILKTMLDVVRLPRGTMVAPMPPTPAVQTPVIQES